MSKANGFDFLATMLADGATYKEPIEHTSPQHHLKDARFYYRVIGNDVHVGIRRSFDRWANSIDFIFSVPKTLNAYKKVKVGLDRAMELGDYDATWCQEKRI